VYIGYTKSVAAPLKHPGKSIMCAQELEVAVHKTQKMVAEIVFGK
jgi:hypothetical protein